MHTSGYDLPGYKNVLVHHNGGWDGEVIVNYQGKGAFGYPAGKPQEFRIPAELLLALSKEVAKDIVIQKVQDALEDI